MGVIDKELSDAQYACEGYSFGSQIDMVVQLQFANDTIIMGKQTWENIVLIKVTLHLVELVSSSRVNFHKIHLIGINDCRERLSEATKVLNCKVSDIPFVYLNLQQPLKMKKLGARCE